MAGFTHFGMGPRATPGGLSLAVTFSCNMALCPADLPRGRHKLPDLSELFYHNAWLQFFCSRGQLSLPNVSRQTAASARREVLAIGSEGASRRCATPGSNKETRRSGFRLPPRSTAVISTTRRAASARRVRSGGWRTGAPWRPCARSPRAASRTKIVGFRSRRNWCRCCLTSWCAIATTKFKIILGQKLHSYFRFTTHLELKAVLSGLHE